jgi:hypothetical protein
MSIFLRKTHSLLAAISLLMLFTNCHHYYQAKQANASSSSQKAATVDSLRLSDRYFILRNGSEAYYMNNISLSADKKTLNCNLDILPVNHQFHLAKGRNGKMKYNKNEPEDLLVLNEVHFFIQPDNTATPGKYTLELDKVQKIEVIEKDKKRTTSSYVIGSLGYTVGSLVVVAIIIAATKSSCPFVSAYDGTDFSLQGEIYGGAIYPQLVRHDYLPLNISPYTDGSLQLKISNELKEHQYTDMAELWEITHDTNTKVFADEKGHLYSIQNPQTPTMAKLNETKDVTLPLQKSGDNTLLYMDDTTAANATNEVVMKFNKPTATKKAKLILSLKNSYFLDLLYGELAKGFGNYYNTYAKNQKQKPASELLLWTKEQQIPLEVSIKTTNGWKKVTDITTIGPLATRNIVVPIEVPETMDSFAEIKLSSGFMFWEIDYAALDYTNDHIFSLQKISPSKATDELGKNILPLLQNEDATYLFQPDIGNTATIIYNTTPLIDASKKRTYILHSKGYYEHIRDFKTNPDFTFLKQFKQPNAFPLFGMRVYKKITSENIITMATSN